LVDETLFRSVAVFLILDVLLFVLCITDNVVDDANITRFFVSCFKLFYTYKRAQKL